MSSFENTTIDFYNEHADEFKESVSSANMSETCDKFLQYLDSGAYILELGCGTGRDALYFKNKGYHVLPTDGSIEMCKITTRTSGIEAKLLRFDDLDFDEEFDGVWACASLLHIERGKIQDVLCKINKALKTNGTLYMSFKYGNGFVERNGRFFSDITENDIPFLCNEKTGFEVKEYFVSADTRPKRINEKWLNIIAKKGIGTRTRQT